MSELNAAATLSLAIDTGGAERKLTELATAYAALKAELGHSTTANTSGITQPVAQISQAAKTAQADLASLKQSFQQLSSSRFTFNPKVDMAFNPLKHISDEVDKQVTEIKVKLQGRINELEAQVATMSAKMATAGETLGKSISVGLSAGAGSATGNIKLPDDKFAELKKRFEALGAESATALTNGFTKSNLTKWYEAISAIEKNTESSLQKIRALTAAAKFESEKVGPASAQAKFGNFIVSGEALRVAEERLAKLAQLKTQAQQFDSASLNLFGGIQQQVAKDQAANDALKAQIRGRIALLQEERAAREAAAQGKFDLASLNLFNGIQQQAATLARQENDLKVVHAATAASWMAEDKDIAATQRQVQAEVKATATALKEQQRVAEATSSRRIAIGTKNAAWDRLDASASNGDIKALEAQLRVIKQIEDLRQGGASLRSIVEKFGSAPVADLTRGQGYDSASLKAYIEQLKKAEADRVQAKKDADRQAAAEDKAYLAEARARYKAHLAELRAMDARSAAERQMHLDVMRKAEERASRITANNQLNANFGYGFGGDQLKALQNQLRVVQEVERMLSAGRSSRDIVGKVGSDAFLAVSSGSTSASNLVAQIEKLRQAQGSLGAASRQSADHQFHWNQAAHEAHSLARGLSGALGNLWITYGSLVPLIAGATIAGSMKKIFSVGKELEYEFAVVSAISNGAAISMEEFNNAVKGTMFVPVEAAKGYRVLAQAGLDTTEAMQALPSVLKLATVGEVDMANAALSATAIMHTFGKQVDDISHIGDVFAKAAAVSATSVKEMMEAMKQASSISNVFGVSLEETAAALATLANRGIEGSAAGTAVRNMVKELASPATEKAANAMKQFGIQIFNADGSSKSLMENLQQLKAVTSTMTAQTKARFLEDLFNERGAKAANILLSDLDKMKQTLIELDAASKGLGFMTDAQIRISQSAEGMLKAVASDVQRVFGEIYTSVEPQIKSIISSISDLVRSEGFKEFFQGVADGVTGLTQALIKHADVLGVVAASYAGLKILETGISLWKVAAVAINDFAIGALVMANRAGAGAATLTVLSSVLSGPVIAGLAAAAAGAYFLYTKYNELEDGQKRVVNEAQGLVDAQKRVNDAVQRGISDLAKSNDLLAKRIQLFREGKSAAEAEATAEKEMTLESARAAKNKIGAQLVDARASYVDAQAEFERKTNAGEGVYLLNKKKRDNAKDYLDEMERLYKDADSALVVAATNSVKAGMEAREKAQLQVKAQYQEEIRLINERTKAVREQADAASRALSENKFYGTEDEIKRQKAKLARDVERGKLVEGWAPIANSDDNAAGEIKRRNAALDAAGENYVRESGKKHAAGGSRAETKDFRSILNDNLSSGLSQEQTSLARELLEIEIQQAAQTLNTRDALEMKNAAARASLEIERLWIQASLEDAKRAKDDVQIKKFSNDLDENAAKLAKQKQQELLEVAKLRVAERNTIEDLARTTRNYTDDLDFERSLLGKTALEAAKLRIEYERMRKYQDINVRLERKQITPEVAQAERDAADAKAAAKVQDEEYQKSFAGGWAKAYDDYAKRATDAAEAAREAFTKATTIMEDAFVQFATTGKVSFRNMATSILSEIVRIQAKILMTQAMSSSGGAGGLLGSLAGMIFGAFSGGGSAPTTSGPSSATGMGGASWLGSGQRLASGGVISGSSSLHQYVNTVQTSPKAFTFDTLHGFAKGGVFAEAGPEAVMPLTRDASGRLGVRAQGAGGGDVITVTNNITIQNDGESKTDSQVQGRAAQQLGQQIEAAVIGIITREKRPGGLLYA